MDFFLLGVNIHYVLFSHPSNANFNASFLLYVSLILMQSALDIKKSGKNRRIASYVMHVGVTTNDH